MGQKYLHLATFDIEGDYIGVVKKHLLLITDGKRVLIKLAKPLRDNLNGNITRMTRIRLSGAIQLRLRDGRLKMRIHTILPMPLEFALSDTSICQNIPAKSACASKQQEISNAKIMICQKSGCRKRGGKKLLSQLQQTLEQQGLHEQVKIQTTGCQKQCRNAPSSILKIGKKKYHQVKPRAIAQRLHQANRET